MSTLRTDALQPLDSDDKVFVKDLMGIFFDNLSPEQFGAVGDGVTNDSAAFNTINSILVARGGGRVDLRKNYFLPTGWVLPCDNIHIDGHSTAVLHGLAATGSDHVLFATGLSNIKVEGLKVTAPRSNLRTGSFACMFANCTNIIFRDVDTDGGTVGNWFYQCSRVRVYGGNIQTPKADGLHFGQGCFDCKAIGTKVDGAGDDSFSITFYDGFPVPFDIDLIGCEASNSIAGAGFANYGGRNVNFLKCRGKELAGNGVLMTTFMSSPVPANCEIDVKIDGCARATKIPNSYWFGTDPLLDPDVPSNYSGMNLTGDTLIVSGGYVKDTRTTTNIPKTGVSLGTCIKSSISGLTLLDIPGKGIYCGTAGCNNVTINCIQAINVIDTVVEWGASIAGPLTITNVNQTFGSTVAPQALIRVYNLGAVRAVIANNVSASGRAVAVDLPTCTNVLNSNNVF